MNVGDAQIRMYREPAAQEPEQWPVRSWAKEGGSSGVSLLLEGGSGQGRPARNAIERGELAGEDAFADEEDLGFFQGQVGCGQHQV